MVNSLKLFISWEEFQVDVHTLSVGLKEKGSWNKIVCITRGGLMPGLLLSHSLNIKHIDTICLTSYDDQTTKQGQLEVIKSLHSKDSDILLIDDLVDTGTSFIKASEMLPNSFRVCVYAKPKGSLAVDIYHKEVPQQTWIVFPWEV